MIVTSPRERRGRRLPALLGATLASVAIACGPRQARLPTIPPPAPILADAASTPGSPETECGQVVAHLRRYGQCELLDKDRRWWVGRWLEAVEADLAIAKDPSIDDASKRQIAVACRKAALVLDRTAERCMQAAATRPR